ncbi:hypothetical protein CWI37_1262p0010 [Hamiltosporidium tvaerminnensis]|uniref:Uncharacterized protein n=1 Tax=Hamiltosporidium tvaerminnensis TaxID=1176355 RepID=A0A4Q9KXJ3_9MICR|nr:hypothetical protein CWI37_1262p0010 [Hamiltosporidium tvaerminnensis]
MVIFYWIVFINYMASAARRNSKPTKALNKTTPPKPKTKSRTTYLHDIAIYLKGCNSLPLRIENHKELNSIETLFAEKYNLKEKIIPRLIAKVNEYKDIIFEKDVRKLYLICFIEINIFLKEQKEELFYKKTDLNTNMFYDKVFEFLKNFTFSNLDDIETNLPIYVYNHMERVLSKSFGQNISSEFVESFISKLKYIDSDENAVIITYLFNKYTKILFEILTYFDDYHKARKFLNNGESISLSITCGINGQITFNKAIFNAEFLEKGYDNLVLFDKLTDLLCNSSVYLSKKMCFNGLNKQANHDQFVLFFDGFDTYNLFELNTAEPAENFKQTFIAFLKSNTIKKFEKVKNDISRTKIYFVLNFNLTLIQFSEIVLNNLDKLRLEPFYDIDIFSNNIKDMDWIKNFLDEPFSSGFVDIIQVLKTLSHLLQLIDEISSSDFDLYLVFEDISRFDYSRIFQTYEVPLDSSGDLGPNQTTKSSDAIMREFKTASFSIFIFLIRDLFNKNSCYKSTEFSIKAANFSNEWTLVQSFDNFVRMKKGMSIKKR